MSADAEYVEIADLHLIHPLTYCRWISKTDNTLTAGGYLTMVYFNSTNEQVIVFQNRISATKFKPLLTFAVKTENIKKMYCKRDARIEHVHNIVEFNSTKLKQTEDRFTKLVSQMEERITLLEDELRYLTSKKS